HDDSWGVVNCSPQFWQWRTRGRRRGGLSPNTGWLDPIGPGFHRLSGGAGRIMAIADYYKRSAVAIAQVVAGFDEKSIRKRLDGISIELVLSPGDAHKPEALSALDLSVRLA